MIEASKMECLKLDLNFELLSSPALIGLIGFNCMPPRAPTTSSNAETKNIINDLAIFLKLFKIYIWYFLTLK